MPGFPIRKSSDLSSVDSSPRLIAASYVLHRLLVPRHPPNALQHLQNKDARVHCAVLKQHTHSNPNPTPAEATKPRGMNRRSERIVFFAWKERLFFQDPTVCRLHPTLIITKTPRTIGPCQRSTHELRSPTFGDISGSARSDPDSTGHSLEMLLRKEVIQPHLPVRLPCYDFVPIADPTFDGSLPQGVRPPASGVTDFHDVTGGVYKARERIHRSVADLRLLATPTSRGRVADPDPN